MEWVKICGKMKIITDINDANKLLQSFKGATLQVCLYSMSLKRIALRLAYPKSIEEVVYIVGIGCESIKGRFRFIITNLSIAVEGDAEIITRITDESEGFELITSGGFSLAQGSESEFGTTFENFLKENN